MKIRLLIFPIFLVALLSGQGETNQEPGDQSGEEVTSVEDIFFDPSNITFFENHHLRSPKKDSNGGLTVDYPEENVRDIIISLADLEGLNIVIPDDLDGTLSIRLRDVSWRDVFDIVLGRFGYGYIETGEFGNIVIVKRLDEMGDKEERRDLQGITLYSILGSNILLWGVVMILCVRVFKNDRAS